MITPAALCLRPRRTVVSTAGITPAQAAAITQGLRLVSSLGGVAYAPQLSLATVNSDGSGGLSSLASPQALGLVLDVSNGLGLGPNYIVNGTPTGSVFAPWESFSTRVVMSASGGWIRATFANTNLFFGQNGLPLMPSATAVRVSFRGRSNRAGTFNVEFAEAGFGFTNSGLRSGFAIGVTEQLYEFVLPLTSFATSFGIVSSTLTNAGDFIEVTDVVIAIPGGSNLITTAATQATTANKPTLGPGALPGFGSMVFDGANDFLSLPNTPAGADGEFFGVAFLPVDNGADRGVFATRADQSPGEFAIRNLAGVAEILMFLSTGVRSENLGLLNLNQYNVLAARRHAGGADYYFNNTTTSQSFANMAYTTAGESCRIGQSAFDSNFLGSVAMAVTVPSGVNRSQAAVIMQMLRAFAGMPLL